MDFRIVAKDRNWEEYPVGTKAFATGGGYWLKVSPRYGWKWFNGSKFPTPGGDANGKVQLPPPDVCNKCGRIFTTPQGLGMHRHHGCNGTIK